MRTVSLATVGCKLNQYETQLLTENFKLNGFRVVACAEDADVVVINTCSVTSRAEATARNLVYRSTKLSPKPYVAITGCYAKRKKDELLRIDGVDFVGASGELLDSLDYTERTSHISSFNGHTRVFVKIQDGCDNFCAFCVLPYIRGKPQSRGRDELFEEVCILCRGGYREIVLTGINIGNYADDGVDLTGLLKNLEQIDSLKRLRLSSIEPTHVTDRFLDYMCHSSKLCSHLHIPLQSGDATILRRMGRRYTSGDYSSLIHQLKQRLPDVAIGADVMVGFPGETKSRFDNTVALIETLPLSYLHVFRYSPRDGTAASKLGDEVAEDEKKRRSAQLISLGRRKWKDYCEAFVGKEMEVLIEHRREPKSGRLVGLSSNYIRALMDGEDYLMGRFLTVRLQRSTGRYCEAEIA